MRYKNILVTGGAGFIGSFLAEKIVNEGANVVVIDDLSRGNLDNLNEIKDKIKFFDVDISDENNKAKISQIIDDNKIEMVMHYAAVNGTLHFYEHAIRTAYVNSYGTLNILNAIRLCKLQSIKHFCFAGTSEVYGEPVEVPTPENAITYARIDETRDSYSIAKQMSEFYVKLWCEEMNIKYNLLRIFNVYGPRMINTKYGQVIPEFIKRVSDGEWPLIMVGDGNQTRSFCYIDDHVDMVIKTVNEISLDNKVINIGNDEEIYIKDLATMIQKSLDVEVNLSTSPPRSGDINRRCPDISLFKKYNKDFKFLSLKEGIQKSINYYK